MQVINPATGEHVRNYDTHDQEQVMAFIGECAERQREWRRESFETRRVLLRKSAELLRERSDKYAALMCEEMGKPITGARSEVEKCAWVCEYYAEHGEAFLQNETIETDARSSFVAYRPLGVVLAVMPWNFPFWQVFRFAAPALMAGNGALLKHASNVPGCALAIEEVFRDAGAPDGLFRTLLIGSDLVGAVLE